MLHLLPYLEMISTTRMTMPQHKREKRKNVFVHLHIWHYLTLTFCGYRYHTTFVVISCISYLIDVWFNLYNANEREEIFQSRKRFE